MKSFVLLTIAVFITFGVSAQTKPASAKNAPDVARNRSDSIMQAVDMLSSLKLPPLKLLLENGRNLSPQTNALEAIKQSEESELKNIRRTWLKWFKLNGTYSYGTTDVNSQTTNSNVNSVIYNVSGQTQRWWNTGASVSIPLEDIFNLHNKIKQQKQRIKSAEYQKAKWQDDLCLQIVESYTAASECLATLKTAAETMVIAKAQYISTESDFTNGQTDPQTLSRQKNIEMIAVREYEQIVSQLNRALLQLEILSKTPIINQTIIGQ